MLISALSLVLVGAWAGQAQQKPPSGAPKSAAPAAGQKSKPLPASSITAPNTAYEGLQKQLANLDRLAEFQKKVDAALAFPKEPAVASRREAALVAAALEVGKSRDTVKALEALAADTKVKADVGAERDKKKDDGSAVHSAKEIDAYNELLKNLESAQSAGDTGISKRLDAYEKACMGLDEALSGITEPYRKDLAASAVAAETIEDKAGDDRLIEVARSERQKLAAISSKVGPALPHVSGWISAASALKAPAEGGPTHLQKLTKLATVVSDGDESVVVKLKAIFPKENPGDTSLDKHLEAWSKGLPALVKRASATAVDELMKDQAAGTRAFSLQPEITESNEMVQTVEAALRLLASSEGVKTAPLSDYQGFAGDRKTLEELRRLALVLRTQVQVVDPSAGAEMTGWVQDQVRLFYFANVPRILTSLNANARIMNPESIQAEVDALTKRRDLMQKDADVAAAFAEVAEMARDLAGLEAEAAQRRRQRDTDLRALEREKRNHAPTKARLEAATKRKDAADQAVVDADAAYQEKKSAYDTINNKPADQLTDDDKKNLPGLKHDMLVAELKLRQAKSQQQKAQDDEKRASDADAVPAQRENDAQAKATKSQNAVDEAENKAEGFGKTLDDKRTELAGKRTALAAARSQSRLLAFDELYAFAKSRDNAPIYVASPGSNTTDVAQRVLMYGYADSSVIFIRGKRDDVDRVKEMIAGFDRPAPQARITLYTLQMNATDEQRGVFSPGHKDPPINAAIADVDKRLRELRTAISFVQDQLRQSIVREVNRAAEVAGRVAKGTPLESQPRLLRSFYYPAEIRQRLGMDIQLSPRRLRLATIERDLQLVLDQTRAIGSVFVHNPDVDGIARDFDIDQLVEGARAARWNSLPEDRQKGKRGDVRRQRLIHGLTLDAFDHLRLASINAERSLRENDGVFTPHQTRLLAAITSVVDAAVSDQVSSRELKELDDTLYRLETSAPSEAGDRKKRSRRGSVAFAIGRIVGDLRRAIEQEDEQARGPDSHDPYLVSEREFVTRWTLPDPVHATTLGEMMFVTILGDKDARERIVSDFIRQVEVNLPSVQEGNVQDSTLYQKLARYVEARMGHPSANGEAGQAFLPAALLGTQGTVTAADNGDGELAANQLEVLLALESKAREATTGEIRFLLRTLYANKERWEATTKDFNDDEAATLLRNQYRTLTGWLAGRFLASQAVTQTKSNSQASGKGVNSFLNQGRLLLKGNGWKTRDEDLDRFVRGMIQDKSASDRQWDQPSVEDQRAWALVQLLGTHNSLSSATPRVAAADDMIKRLIEIAEDDLDRLFVADQLEGIRRDVTKHGVQLGVLQRESILATNRLVARVDPQANASLEVAQGTDFRDAATQLGNIAEQFRALNVPSAATTAGLAGVGTAMVGKKVSQISPFTFAGVLGLADILSGQAPEQKGDIYSINSGNLFKVTPIFDPSGQALRFKFDFTATTNVQDASGATPPLPRVERHTVNTEVQLTNLEFREISRFESNARVGSGDVRQGGIPILKELPLLRDLPLIGYYSRRNASAASRQESLIFAQTSIYPTVSDLVDLLIDVIPRPDYDNEPPKGLFEPASSSSGSTGVVVPPPVVPPTPTTVNITQHHTVNVGTVILQTPPPKSCACKGGCGPTCKKNACSCASNPGKGAAKTPPKINAAKGSGKGKKR